MSAELMGTFEPLPRFEFTREQEEKAAHLYNLQKDIHYMERAKEEVNEPAWMGYVHPAAGRLELSVAPWAIQTLKTAAGRLYEHITRPNGQRQEEGKMLADNVINRAAQPSPREYIVFRGNRA